MQKNAGVVDKLMPTDRSALPAAHGYATAEKARSRAAHAPRRSHRWVQVFHEKRGMRADNFPAKIGHQLQVLVRENNVDQALRLLKKRMQREGIFREMKQRSFYEKPSEKRVREKAEAVRRARKLARKQAQRDGLLPRPKPRVRDDRRGRPPRPTAHAAT